MAEEPLTPSQQSGETPTLQPAFMGEWTYNSANVPPPANAQLRLNTSAQANATAIYVSNISFNGIDARDWLMDMSVGGVIRLEEKGVPTRFHTFTISSAPIQQSGYVELRVTWLSGGQNLTTSVMVSVVSSMVRVTGTTATASTRSVVVSLPARVPVTAPAMTSAIGATEIHLSEEVYVTGEPMFAWSGSVSTDTVRFLPGYAFPGTSPDGVSLGMTMRQWYAGQAIVGFVSSNPAANLIGRLPQFCFRLADSMIAFEEAEAAGFIESPIPTNAPPRGQQTQPVPQAVAPTPTQAVALRQVR